MDSLPRRVAARSPTVIVLAPTELYLSAARSRLGSRISDERRALENERACAASPSCSNGYHPTPPRQTYRSRSFLLLFSLARPLLVAVSRPCLLWAAWVAVITASPSRRRFLSSRLPCPGLLPRQLILPLILVPACVSSCSSSSLFFSFFHSCDLDFIFGIWILLLCFLRVFLFGDFFFFFF